MRVGIVGDLHLPWAHPLYLDFCRDTFDAWNCDKIVFIGDIVDHHCLSFHDTDPNGKSAEDEADWAESEVANYYREWPRAKVTIGNHCERHLRSARKAGIPDRYIRTYKELWNTPKWDWKPEHIIEGVLYEHGTGSSGKDAALNRAMAKRMSLVQGHVHSWGGCKFHTNPTSVIFGLNVGCGIDIDAYCFAYGRPFANRPTLGCGVVLDGEDAYFELMKCASGEKYHRSRCGKKRA
jgi:hypothetical protein